MAVVINEKCIVFGSRADNDWQGNLYSGKSDDTERDFADLGYALDSTKASLYHGKAELGYPGSLRCHKFNSGIGTLIITSHGVRQIALKETVAGQFVLCDMAEVLDGNRFLEEVFGIAFLRSDEIGMVAQLAEEDEVSYEKVVRRVRYAKTTPREERCLPRYDFGSMTEARKRTLATVCGAIMQDQQVLLQLPADCTAASLSTEFLAWLDRLSTPFHKYYMETVPPYELLCMDVLLQILQMTPQADRCLMSFATAVTTEQANAFGSQYKLMLSDDTEPRSFDGGLCVVLDQVEKLEDEAVFFMEWCNMEQDIRSDIEFSEVFDFNQQNRKRTEWSEENLRKDMELLQGICQDYFQYIKGNDQISAVSSLKELRGDKDDNDEGKGYLFADRPVFSIKKPRAEFLNQLRSRIDLSMPSADDLGFALSEQGKNQYADSLTQLIFNDLFSMGKDYLLSYEDIGRQERDKEYYQEYFDNLLLDLCKPFLTYQKDEDGQELKNDPMVPVAGSVTINGITKTYSQIVAETKDALKVARSFFFDE